MTLLLSWKNEEIESFSTPLLSTADWWDKCKAVIFESLKSILIYFTIEILLHSSLWTAHLLSPPLWLVCQSSQCLVCTTFCVWWLHHCLAGQQLKSTLGAWLPKQYLRIRPIVPCLFHSGDLFWWGRFFGLIFTHAPIWE